MRYLVLALLCGCATLKPVPSQTLTCLKNEAPGAAAQAGVAFATGATVSKIESIGLSVGLQTLECEALAIWSDLEHAQSVATANAVDVVTVQSNAQNYLVAKGILTAAPQGTTGR